jgi:hypothetical protein
MDCECDKTITTAADDQQLPPCSGTPMPASKQKTVIGSCIGVLYTCGKANPNSEFCTNKCGTRVYCVHNGRLVKDTKEYILVNHYTLSGGVPKEETRIFYKKNHYPRVLSYKVTPDLPTTDAHYCASFRNPASTQIVPPECVGIQIKNDIKNGRYLYWEEKSGKFHCVIPASGSGVYRVYYAHFPKPKCNPGNKKPVLAAELTCKDDVIRVLKTDEKNLGPAAKC